MQKGNAYKYYTPYNAQVKTVKFGDKADIYEGLSHVQNHTFMGKIPLIQLDLHKFYFYYLDFQNWTAQIFI
jgi:hypothetical protein